jgi:hypothetical protein
VKNSGGEGRDAGLLQDSVRCMAGEDVVVNRKAAVGDGAVPDFVNPTSSPFKFTTVGAENFLELRRIAGHQDARAATPLSSCS